MAQYFRTGHIVKKVLFQVFVDQIFRIFDKDGNGSIDFKVTFQNFEPQFNDGKTKSFGPEVRLCTY